MQQLHPDALYYSMSSHASVLPQCFRTTPMVFSRIIAYNFRPNFSPACIRIQRPSYCTFCFEIHSLLL